MANIISKGLKRAGNTSAIILDGVDSLVQSTVGNLVAIGNATTTVVSSIDNYANIGLLASELALAESTVINSIELTATKSLVANTEVKEKVQALKLAQLLDDLGI